MPARLGSRRVAHKPLRCIEGRPLVLHVLERARAASCVSRVVLATDDASVAEVARRAGHEVVATGPAVSGSARVAAAYEALGASAAVVVNVQGDQPRLDPAHIDAAVTMVRAGFDVGTVSAPLEGDPARPSRVKVVDAPGGRALYFSRAPVPHGGPYRLHVGVYAFRGDVVARCAACDPGRLAASEGLEQLAWLEAGIAIGVARVDRAVPAVDEESDLLGLDAGRNIG